MVDSKPELRRDIVSGRYVVIAPGRAKRPQKQEGPADEKKEMGQPGCVFCEGNEANTPLELLACSDNPDRKPNAPGWTVRVFENKFPTFIPGSNIEEIKEGIYTKREAIGHHEIVVTADHNKDIAQMPRDEVALMLSAFQDRLKAFRKDPEMKYMMVINNHGEEAGASLPHPHSQLFALPFVPKDIQIELDGSRRYEKEHGKCVFCAIIEYERKAAKRFIFENDNFAVLAPYASQARYESWVLPKAHEQHYDEMTEKQRLDMAEALQFVLKGYYNGMDDPPFNFFLNSAPIDGKKYGYYHWHLQVLPTLSKRAGLEYGTGVIVNTTAPEEAAEFLRKANNKNGE